MLTELRFHAWAYPALEVLHLLGIALLIGNLALIDLLIFKHAPIEASKRTVRLGLSLMVAGFSLATLSGALMFASQPAELMANRAFTLKMVLLIVAGCNAIWFHLRGSLQKVDALAKIQLAVSLLVWAAVVVCGKWIAYI